MANVKDLIAALGKVAIAYQPDPNDDPDATEDPLDDPDDDAGGPNDDPRSYDPDDDEADKENGEDEDGDDEDDFSRPHVFNTVMLLQRLTNEADQKDLQQRKVAHQLRIAPPLTKLQQKNEKLFQMRRKAAEVEAELRLNRQLEVQSKRLQKANLELYKANRTDRERKQLDADTRRMAIAFSRVCPEAHPDWREQAAEEWRVKSVK